MAAQVEFREVTKRYGSVAAVRSVSFVIEPGTLVTLLGPSGCGKTTTLRMIAGLELASEGRILIGGRDVTRLPATERDVTMVFQSYALFPHMTVLENVSYGLAAGGLKKPEVEERARNGLERVGLRELAARLPSELSGGQQQRVAVARALVLEPEVLLFDEPLSNLDAKLRRKMREEIRELQRELGVTAVYVTHDQAEALSVSDKIIVMDGGVIAQEGTPRDLYEAPRSRFIAEFIGEANLVSGRLRRSAAGMCVVAIGGVELELPHRDLPEGEVRVAIRPESVELAPVEETVGAEGAVVAPPAMGAGRGDDGRGGQAGQALEGRVVKSVYLGSHMEYTVRTAVGDLFVVGPRAGAALAANDRVRVTFARTGVAVVA